MESILEIPLQLNDICESSIKCVEASNHIPVDFQDQEKKLRVILHSLLRLFHRLWIISLPSFLLDFERI